jgi:type II secretory ATPase GspE/PulE/Tfp pilus assembly ATPase PilB-like protein
MPEPLQIANCKLQIANWVRTAIQAVANLQFAICNLQFAMAFVLLLIFPGVAAAATEPFPRGPGFYFDPIKLVLLILVYFCWVSTCRWVDRDAAQLKLPAATWNPIMLGGGLLGLALLWMLPWFWLSFLLLLLCYLVPTLSYVNVRNQKVAPEQRVLTERHLKLVAQSLFKLNLGVSEEEEKPVARPIRFIGKSFNQSEEDPNRVARAEGSRGYKAALEMVHEAIEKRVTDIHLEPTKEEMSVRFRIDGILQPSIPFSRHMGDSVINIFKVLCDMDITEKRKPQDGSFSAEVEGHSVDFRVATAGSVAGEKLVMRILDRAQQMIHLKHLGMRDRMYEQIVQLVRQPHGMIIVCGPTGAGKTTTLYAALNEIDRFQKNVITIENPVEYQLPNATQIEVNLKAGKTFASELRSILRQDPDVILIGEVRDAETAEIACQAAQTGHMVFTTLHANDTITALGRLIDLGVQPFMIASAVTAILGQRLVRVLCPRCKVRYKPNPDMLRKANLPAEKIKYFYRTPAEADQKPKGEEENVCERCGNTGYHSRTGIFELLVITDRIRDLIRENPNLTTIKQEAVKSGMRYLQEDGLRQVIEGKTSIQELLRVSK